MNQATWEARAEWPLAGAAIVFLIAYSTQVIGKPTGTSATILTSVIWIIWTVFLIDYAARLYLAERRRRWFLRNIHELLIVALPMLRPLRLLRLITLLRTLHKIGGHALRGRLITYVIASVTILSYVAALTVLDVERNAPGATITSMGDALWWAMATITTVGYGDFYPVTVIGRLIAVALMIGGIAVLGVVTATLASWLVESVAAETTAEVESGDQALQKELAEVKEQLRLLLESNGTTASDDALAQRPSR